MFRLFPATFTEAFNRANSVMATNTLGAL